METLQTSRADAKLDNLGMIVSGACAVHCALMPILVTLLPVVGASFLSDEKTEIALFAAAFLIGAASLIPSFVRRHRKIVPLILFTGGFISILAAHFLFEEDWRLEVLFSVVGALLFTAAHFINYRLCRPLNAAII